ncbi:MAG TPA: helix-turn-helix domain-containing protein, partial [Bacillota bacterium]|nr:helix-turn-helix domain-containing protein [Bacillota bacterium]
LNDYRIHQAIALMQQQPSMQITEIATTVGFNDPNYFARIFKDLTNKTPTMYREKFNGPIS